MATLSLPSQAYDTSRDERVLQLTETAVLNARAINETRFQFMRAANGQSGDNSVPALNVLGAFSGGGSQMGRASRLENHWEFQNQWTLASGVHSLKFGARLRGARVEDVSAQNFGGTFTFSGGTFGPALDEAANVIAGPGGAPEIVAIDSLERYRRTLLLDRLGFSPDRIRVLGGGASLFTLAAGNPLARVWQVDVGAFLQDDWRIRPNLTLSTGLRYEAQTNVSDWTDLGPRIGFAWAPGRDPQKRKTVLRGGVGVFYGRFGENLTLQTRRFDGLNQQQFIIADPVFFPAVPPAGTLAAASTPVATWRTAPDARALYLVQWSMGIERQLPGHTTIASTLTYSSGEHYPLSRNVNAPLPGTYAPGVPGSGVRPFGPGDIFQYETNGVTRRLGWQSNGTSRIGRKIALFGMYGYGVVRNNGDLPGSFPADQYDVAGARGPARPSPTLRPVHL